MRVFAWPRSPRKTMSCPARIAFSTAGRTVSAYPTTPGKISSPVGQAAEQVGPQLLLDGSRPVAPMTLRSPRVDGRAGVVDGREWLMRSSMMMCGSGRDRATQIAVDRGPDVGDGRDAGRGQCREQIAPARLLGGEVARPAPGPFGELGDDAPREVLEAVHGGIPRREHGGREPLDVAARVTRHGSDVVRRPRPGAMAHGRHPGRGRGPARRRVARARRRSARGRGRGARRTPLRASRRGSWPRARSPRLIARIAMRACSPHVYMGRCGLSSCARRYVEAARISRSVAAAVAGASRSGGAGVRIGDAPPRHPSWPASGSQSNVSRKPRRLTTVVPAGRKSRRAVSTVVFPARCGDGGNDERQRAPPRAATGALPARRRASRAGSVRRPRGPVRA